MRLRYVGEKLMEEKQGKHENHSDSEMNQMMNSKPLTRKDHIRLWFEGNKHEIIFYSIATIMIVSFILYLIWAYLNDVPLRFN